ncbi:MAG: MFS transporter [Candidatus Micrarchaeota archaeon]|nr:MFS transporter [Candidatus Micrarchaeota archaeon]
MGLLDKISPNVLLLGIVSFFTDVSSEMIFPLLPLFLTTYLGASQAAIGLIEGIGDSFASLLDIFVGYFADKGGNYKRYVAYGYGLSSLVKAGIALATSWPQMIVLRGAERLGKSIRTAPRDAIISLSSDEKVRGRAFGLHRAMDTLGAIAGPAIAYVILSSLDNSEAAYRTVFWAALVPAVIAVLAIILLVREPQKSAKFKARKKLPFFQALGQLDVKFKRFLLISGLFSLSYFSFALLIVRASQLGVSAERILLLYLLYNILYAAASVPVGMLSDKIGRKPIIAAAFALFGLVCLGFAYLTAVWQIALLFALYGVFVAADDSVNKAYISELVGEQKRATALGAYNTACGAVYLPANILFGAAWAAFGVLPAFGAAALIAFAAAVWMMAAKLK